MDKESVVDKDNNYRSSWSMNWRSLGAKTPTHERMICAYPFLFKFGPASLREHLKYPIQTNPSTQSNIVQFRM